MKNFEYLCFDCGNELYPNHEIQGDITVSSGTCPRCKKKDVTLTPVRDLETGNKGADWD